VYFDYLYIPKSLQIYI